MKIKRWLFSIATVYFFATSGLAAAEEIILRWHANVESDLQGYNIYYGNQSKAYYPPIPVGKINEYTVPNLDPGQTYFFAITAVDSAGNESDYSSESSLAIPETDNQAPSLAISSVISSADDGNVAANTIDNNLATRWSAEGSGQWIQYDLGATHSISEAAIAFYRGDTRIADFEIFVSDDAQSWNSALKGQSSGTTLQPEIYKLTDATGRFIRIVGYGNSSNTWNSITEVDIVGEKYTPPADTTNPTIAINTPTTDAIFNTASNTLSLVGTADDDQTLQAVTWSASDGQSGTASGTANWSTGPIQLAEGDTTFTVTATDAAGNKAVDRLTVTRLAYAYFEDFGDAAGVDPADWLDTAARDSLVEDDSLFKAYDVGGEIVFGTTSTLRNIHSHYMGAGYDAAAGIVLTGRMRMSDASSDIGVTFLSDYPNSDTYYLLRRYRNTAFHLHPHGTTVAGVIDSGVVPVANTWYLYKIKVIDTGSRTEIKANVWPEGSEEPAGWQIDAWDDSATCLTNGRIGVWSNRAGGAYWDDIAVELMSPVNPPPVANCTVAPLVGAYPLEVSFDGWESEAFADGTIVLYEWDFDGDGIYDWSGIDKTSGITIFTYNTSGVYNAVLRVTDDEGATDTDSVTVTVSEPDY